MAIDLDQVAGMTPNAAGLAALRRMEVGLPDHPPVRGYGWHIAGTAELAPIIVAVGKRFSSAPFVSTSLAGAEALRAGAPCGVEFPPLPTIPVWISPLVEQLEAILGLPEGWNSYGAARIDGKTAVRAVRLLLKVAGLTTPAPSVVPTPSGGVQLEWHERDIDLEVELTPQGQVSMHYADDLTGEDWDEDITHNLSPLARVLTELTSRR
jgi:hypothetical protein